jgi:hypothetical protein
MRHLKDVNMSYITHLLRAYKVAVILMVHGIFPKHMENKEPE